MTKNAKITVITPTYNREKTLPRIYDSLLNQTFKDFKWLILDDGSTDHTQEVIEQMQAKNQIEIESIFHENQKKFITLQRGIKTHVNTDFFIVMDSDDEFYPDALQVFYQEAEKIKDNPKIGSVVGHTVDKNKQLIGTPYPKSPLDCHIFEMRHLHQVKGGKLSIIQTSKYKEFDYNLDFYQDKGYIPDDVWQNIFDVKYQSRFINEILKIYYLDASDAGSLTNSRYTKKSAFGMMESYRTALNTYANRFYKFPIVITKKVVGYLYFGFNANYNALKLIKRLNSTKMKFLSILLIIPSFAYAKLKPLK